LILVMPIAQPFISPLSSIVDCLSLFFCSKLLQINGD
jgi:hypothetical protein